MSLGRYLRSQWASMLVSAMVASVLWLVLSSVDVTRDLRLLLCGLVLAAEVLRLAAGYLPGWRFWRALNNALHGDESPLSVCDLVAEPHFLEGDLAWTALDTVAQEGRTKFEQARAESAEYREFVEAWVHEVKTPVAAAKLACENNPGQQSLQLLRELDRVDGYVEQALYYARSGSVERDYRVRSLQVSQLVRQAVKAQMRPLIDAGVRVQMGEGLDLEVFTDDKWMVFSLGQVIQNAAKYAAHPQREEPATLTFGARMLDGGLANERVELYVSDNGPGIDAADLPRIFEKGFVGANGRRADQAKSTGLGLYLVKRLCTKMGMDVRADSAEGAGTTITFVFPANRSQLVDRA